MYVDGNLSMLTVIYTAADGEVFLQSSLSYMCPEIMFA